MQPASQNIRVVVADDHFVTLLGFAQIFASEGNISLVAAVTDGQQLVTAVEEHRPDVVITDLHMPNMDGAEACVKILRQNPDASIIVCSMYDHEDLVRRLRGLGVKGYLVKGICDEKEIRSAVTVVYQGGEYFCPSVRQRTNGFFRGEGMGQGVGDLKSRFSRTELEIIRLICEGRSSKEIAYELKIKLRTITAIKEGIEKKMGVQHTVDIAVYATKNWLLYEDEAVYQPKGQQSEGSATC